MTFRKYLAALITVLLPLSPHSAAAETPQEFAFLKWGDYLEVTGCTAPGYRSPLTDALRFLAFPEADTGNPNNSDILYARRHTRPFFVDLLDENQLADGTLDPNCLPPSLYKVALALKLLNEDGKYTAAEPWIDHVYGPHMPKAGPPLPQAYPVLTRQLYMERTGCLISSKTYDNYRLAYETLVLERSLISSGQEEMVLFLNDLVDSQPAPEEFLQQKCLIEPISRIAEELGLLDADGRYQRQPE